MSSDLSFDATLAGLCGSPRITDVGGVPYLIPLAQTHKVGADETIDTATVGDERRSPLNCSCSSQEYDMNAVAKEVELPGAFVLGAAGAPSRILGMNGEVNPFF